MSLNPKHDHGWITVGKKKNEKKMLKQFINSAPLEDIHPSDIMKANDDNPLTIIQSAIIDAISQVSPVESMDLILNTANFVLDIAISMVKEKTCVVSDIPSDQRKLIAIDGYTPSITDGCNKLKVQIANVENYISSMNTIRVASEQNIKRFLTSYSLDEIKDIPLESCTETENKSYASSIGCTISPLVTNRQSFHKTNNNTTHIEMNKIANIEECREFTIHYLESHNTSVIKIDNTIFTAGSGEFVNRNLDGNKNKYAKRCSSLPCKRTICKFYHDPITNTSIVSYNRVFALSYINQILSMIKNETDITKVRQIRNLNFVRDLVQLAGIILYRASQIKFKYLKSE